MKNIWLDRKKGREEKERCELSYNHRQKLINKNYNKWLSDNNWSSRLKLANGKEIAILLDNQSLWCEISGIDFLEKTYEIYENFIGFDIISIQPMLGPRGIIYYKKYNLELSSEDLYAKTRQLNNLKSSDISNEMSREIFKDLNNNIGSERHQSWSNIKNIHNHVQEIDHVLYSKTLRFGQKWIVTGTEIASMLMEEDISVSDVSNVGIFNEYKVIVDPLYGREILCGSQDEFLNGYFYNPYLLTNIPDRLLLRHSKKLLDKNYYGRIIYR